MVLTLGEMWEDGCDYYNFFYDKDRKILRLYYLAFKMLGAHDGIESATPKAETVLNGKSGAQFV